jgi:hypothetical protein
MVIAYSRERQYKEIGHAQQLFLDDDLVARVRNVKRTLHSPRKHPANPLIQRDQPWEVIPYFRLNTFNVVRDPADGHFKCWYEDYYDYFGIKKENVLQGNRLYYAQSTDGLRWEKPGLGKLRIDGHDTNTVFSYPPYEMASCNSVLLDLAETDPSRRFKTVYYQRYRNANVPKRTPRGPHAAGLGIAFSPDGIDWTPYAGNPILPNWGSDVEILTYDPIARTYVLYGRAEWPWNSPHPKFDGWFAPIWPDQPPGIWGTRRCIYRLTSPDCLEWSEPELVFAPDQNDNLQDGHYGFVSWRVGDLHLGILNILHQVDNTLDGELLYSRDGHDWKRFPNRQPLIPRGPAGSYDHLLVECPTSPIVVGDEIWLYYGGNNVHHDWWIFGGPEGLDVPEARDPSYAQNGHHLCLATLRLDGWVSLDATVREGCVETKPIFSDGSTLFVNARCDDGGYVAVEVMDNWGNIWEGFGREQCDVFRGNAVAHAVSWQGQTAINTITGMVTLRFHLKRAELYGFRIANV